MIGEKGLLIGIIGKTVNSQYSGYANNSQASRTKIIENVFKNGTHIHIHIKAIILIMI